MLRVFLFETKHDAELVSAVQKYITSRVSTSLDEAWDFPIESQRRRNFPSSRDHKQWRGDRLTFQGDDVCSTTDRLRPPIAWTVLWRGTYSNQFGYYIPEAFRRWGYVFWDAERFELMKAESVLERQHKERWRNRDTRMRYPL